MTIERQVTPRLSHHARERCKEMGISTMVAKRIYQHRTMTYPGIPGSDAKVAISDVYPDYAIVVDDAHEPPLITTVLFRTEDEYVREGKTYRVVERDE